MGEGIANAKTSNEGMWEAIGALTAATTLHTGELSTLFEKFDDLKESVDKNLAKADYRDKALEAVQKSIDGVNSKIENGLRKEVRDTSEKVDKLGACIERRKIEREEMDKKGIRGYFKRGFEEFRYKSAYILTTSLILGTVFFIIWVSAKVSLFHEGLPWILHAFGLGK